MDAAGCHLGHTKRDNGSSGTLDAGERRTLHHTPAASGKRSLLPVAASGVGEARSFEMRGLVSYTRLGGDNLGVASVTA